MLTLASQGSNSPEPFLEVVTTRLKGPGVRYNELSTKPSPNSKATLQTSTLQR